MPNFDKSEIDLYVSYQRETDSRETALLAQYLRRNGLKVIGHLGALKFQKSLGFGGKKWGEEFCLLGRARG